MNIIQYDPWRKLQQLQREMGGLFNPRLNTDDDGASLTSSVL